MHLSTSRTRLVNLCLVSLISLSYRLIVRAVFKSVYCTSRSFRLISSCLISSSFCRRSCFNCAFSSFNLSCKYIKCFSFPSKELMSFLSSSVISYQILHKYRRLESNLKIFSEEFDENVQKYSSSVISGFCRRGYAS